MSAMPAPDGQLPPRAADPAPRLEPRPIHPFYAALLHIYGPADSPSNPLAGTQHDHRLGERRQHEQAERYRVNAYARWQRWDKRLHGHNPLLRPPRQPPREAGPDVSGPVRQTRR
jgi:hypothetical protein